MVISVQLSSPTEIDRGCTLMYINQTTFPLMIRMV